MKIDFFGLCLYKLGYHYQLISFVCYILFLVGNRRGRRGGYRGPKKETNLKEFEDDYDFEGANANFKKEEIEEELQKKLGLISINDDEVLCEYYYIRAIIYDQCP